MDAVFKYYWISYDKECVYDERISSGGWKNYEF